MNNDENSGVKISTWEIDEIQRSANEALKVTTTSLWMGDKKRYMSPPEYTVYPLEYCYYLIGDIKGKDVLDLGCGAGENTLMLVLRGARVWALDISPELVDLARKRFEVNSVSPEKVQFVIGSAYEMKLLDESVDVVFGIGILHHLDLKRIQKEVYRILRKGGFAIFQEPVRDSKAIHFVRSLIPYKSPDVSPFERPLTSQELQAFAAPFKHVEERSFCLPHINVVNVFFSRWFHEAAYKIDGKLLASLPFLSPYAGVRVLKLTK